MEKLFHLYNGVPRSNKGKQMTDTVTRMHVADK